MSANIEESVKGVNWRIERGLVLPGIAETAGLEILGGIATRDDMISHDHTQAESGYEGYIIHGLDEVTKKHRKSPVFAFRSLMVVRDALNPYRDPEWTDDLEEGQYSEGFINVTAPGGKIGRHRDNEPWSQIFVNLMGKMKVAIDSADGSHAEEVLKPGDAFRIDNPTKKRKRPKHELTNLSRFTRVSYGEQLRWQGSRSRRQF